MKYGVVEVPSDKKYSQCFVGAYFQALSRDGLMYAFSVMKALNQDGRVVAVFIMLDMVDYLSMPVIHSDSALFEMLGKYGKVVEQKLRQREWKRG